MMNLSVASLIVVITVAFWIVIGLLMFAMKVRPYTKLEFTLKSSHLDSKIFYRFIQHVLATRTVSRVVATARTQSA